MDYDLAKHIYREILKESYGMLARQIYEHRTLVFLGSFFKKSSEINKLTNFLRDADAAPNLRNNVFTLLYLRGKKQFSGLNLSKLNLFGYEFSGFAFNNCNFEASDLRRTNLHQTKLHGALLGWIGGASARGRGSLPR